MDEQECEIPREMLQNCKSIEQSSVNKIKNINTLAFILIIHYHTSLRRVQTCLSIR